ncbi:MAG: hypothetical protein V1720_20240 [bacterium]
MKKLFLILIIVFGVIGAGNGQDKSKDRDRESPELKTSGISDRAGGTHNGSNIGLFFENRGKLYPRRITQGPSGEFPINSTMNYIYRINPMVGVPGNVMQGRYTTNEEWEAIGGYHNPEISSVAFSDNPQTWHPVNGWPIKDAGGNPIIKSDQDSFCAYNDSNNTKKILGVEINQTGYTYGVKFAQNIIFYRFDVINKGSQNLSDLYFNLYSDMDIGDISGGDAEYGDDFLDFDKENNFVYFFDDGASSEWPGGKTGYFGVALLKTPLINGVEAGITDMHYNLYNDDQDIDSLQYGIMASKEYLFNSDFGDRYFHLGTAQNIHFDDPATIPAEGMDLLANVSSGPYTLSVGDTLTFVTAILAGWDKNEIYNSLEAAKTVVNFNFEISKPPAAPALSAVAGDESVTLYWDDKSEKSLDKFSGEYDFEGYRLYRSQDKGVTWSQLVDCDLVNFNGFDTGLKYSYVDTDVTNGFEYWYSITAYDRGDSSIASLESPKGSTIGVINLVSVIPQSAAIGFAPVSAGNVLNIGTGNSNYVVEVNPTNNNSLGGNQYELGFGYVTKKEKGNFNTELQIVIRDENKTYPSAYGIEFLEDKQITIIDLLTGEYLERYPRNYVSGGKYNVSDGLQFVITDPDPNADPELLPQPGDYMTVKFASTVVRNSSDTVLALRAINVGQTLATDDGVLFTLNPPEIIQNVSRIGGTDPVEITFSVSDETLVKKNTYLVSTEGKGINNNEEFTSVVVRDELQTSIASFDTLYNLDSFEFDGLEGNIEFNSNSAPSAGNIFSVTTVVPIQPTLKDRYQFGVNESSINSQSIQDNISKIKVVPNPYIVSSLYEPEYGELRKEPLRQIQFINLPNECTIYIYTVDADLVKTLHHSAANGTETWDLRAEAGREIAPGIYIYHVQAQGTEYLSRFAIIK